jgi:hypothetical protein
MEKQDLSKLQTRKMKGLKRARKDNDEGAESGPNRRQKKE